MSDLNKVMIIGRLGADPETRYMPSGKPVTNLRVATSEKWKDKQTSERKEKTEWHSLVLFDKSAEIAAEYLRKGSQAYFEGKLQTRKWKDKEGKDRYTTEIVVHEFQMLGSPGGQRQQQQGRPPPPRQQPPNHASRPAPREHEAAGDEFDDDIPF